MLSRVVPPLGHVQGGDGGAVEPALAGGCVRGGCGARGARGASCCRGGARFGSDNAAATSRPFCRGALAALAERCCLHRAAAPSFGTACIDCCFPAGRAAVQGCCDGPHSRGAHQLLPLEEELRGGVRQCRSRQVCSDQAEHGFGCRFEVRSSWRPATRFPLCLAVGKPPARQGGPLELPRAREPRPRRPSCTSYHVVGRGGWPGARIFRTGLGGWGG